MNMKKIIPVLMMATAPIMGMGQNNQDCMRRISTRMFVRRMTSTSSQRADGRKTILCLPLTAGLEVLISFRKTTTSA